MTSEVSDNTDTISADLISKIFAKSNFPLPDKMSKTRFSIFRVCLSLIHASRNMYLFSRIFFIIRAIQCLCFTSYVAVLNQIERGETLNSTYQFVYFFIHLRLYNGNDLNPVYFLIIIFISSLCIIFFFYMFFSTFLNENVSKWTTKVGVILIIELVPILLFVVTQNFMSLFLFIFTKKIETFYFITALFFICLVFLSIISFYSTNAIRQSMLYSGGEYLYYPSFPTINSLYIAFIISINLYYIFVSQFYYKIIITILYIIYGIVFIFIGGVGAYLSDLINSIVISYGLVFLAFGGYQLSSIFDNDISPRLILYITAIIFFIGMILSNIFFKIKSEMIANKLKIDQKFFEHRQRMNDFKLLEYTKVAVQEALPCALDLSFLEQVINYNRSSWIYHILFRYSYLINESHQNFSKLKQKMIDHPSFTCAHQFIELEYKLYQFAKLVQTSHDGSQITFDDLNMKISQYQLAVKTFTSSIGSNSNSDYLLTDSIRSMQSLIRYQLSVTKSFFPNYIETLKVCSFYERAVKFNNIKANIIDSMIEDLEKRHIAFVDYTHFQALSAFPKIKKCIINKALKGKNSEKISFKIPFLQSASIPFIQPASQSSSHNFQQNLLAIFGTLKPIIYIFSVVVVTLLYISTLVHLFSLPPSEQSYYNQISRVLNFIELYFQTCSSFCHFEDVAIYSLYNEQYLNSSLLQFVLNLTFNFEYHMRQLSNVYRVYSEDQNFYESFSILSENYLTIPSVNTGYFMESDFIFLLNRLSSLLLANVNAELAFVPAPELATFVETSQYLSSAFVATHRKIYASVLDFIEKITNDTNMYSYYSSIPSFIFFIISFIIPIFIYFEFKKLVSLFPHKESKHTQSILYTFLSHDFTSFQAVILKFLSINVIFPVIVIISIIPVYYINRDLKGYVNQNLFNILNCAYQVTNNSGLLLDFFQYLLLDRYPSLNATMIEDEIVQSFTYFTVSLNYSSFVKITGNIKPIADFYYLAFSQYKYNTVTLDYAVLLEMNSLLFDDISPIISNTVSQLTSNTLFTANQAFINLSSIIIIYLLILTIFYIFDIILVNQMWKNLKILRIMLAQLPDQFISTSEKLVDLLQEKMQLSNFTEFRKSSILDFVSNPCALVSNEGTIIKTNRAWATFFKRSLDYMIGQEARQILINKDIQYTENNVDDNFKLIVLSENKHEDEKRKEIKILKEKINILKSSIIPIRFLHVNSEETVHIPFVSACSIMIIPSFEDINPDQWLTDVHYFEQWINNQCEIYKNVDIIHGAGRDLQILFGIDEVDEKHTIVAKAFSIMCNVLRYSIESYLAARSFFVSIIISSGQDATFKFYSNEFSLIDMFGDTFEKQMVLREKIEPASIICDELTYSLIRECQFGINLEQIDIDAYQFKVDHFVDDIIYEYRMNQEYE